MENVRNYNPFNTKDYFIIKQQGKDYFNYKNILLELCDNGYIPKSGLLYDMILNRDICYNKKVLDLGCGYLGILGIIAYFNGAKSVDSIDFDYDCVNWFNKIISENNINNINCFNSDYFENVNSCYDLILANPPQMPMIDGSLHDSGGIDGRKYILKIMKDSINYLNDNGNLYLLLFDFLGIDVRTNDDLSLIEIANDYGYSSADLVFTATKIIEKGSVTYNNISYITKVYPYYNFDNEEKKQCQIKILKLKR